MTQPSPSSLPSENFQRGLIFALLALPAGIIVWDIIWSAGFVASLVAFGVAWLAMRLYRFGSGGRISRNGAIAVTVVTVLTLVLAFISGYVIDNVVQFTQQTGGSIPEGIVDSRVWSFAFQDMVTGQAFVSLLLAAAFGLLGCFSILRGAFRQVRMPQAESAPVAPPSGAQAPTDAASGAPSASGQTRDGRPRYGQMLDSQGLDNQTSEGTTLNGMPVDGRPLDGRSLDGRPLDGPDPK